MEDLDEESYKKRKQEQVAYREKKRLSTIFMFIATVFEILETLLIMLVLFILDAFILLKIFNPESPTIQIIFQISTIVIFIGSLVLGFLLYKKLIRWVIVKFNLKEKLMDDVIIHYIKPSKDEMEAELRR